MSRVKIRVISIQNGSQYTVAPPDKCIGELRKFRIISMADEQFAAVVLQRNKKLLLDFESFLL